MIILQMNGESLSNIVHNIFCNILPYCYVIVDLKGRESGLIYFRGTIDQTFLNKERLVINTLNKNIFYNNFIVNT